MRHVTRFLLTVTAAFSLVPLLNGCGGGGGGNLVANGGGNGGGGAGGNAAPIVNEIRFQQTFFDINGGTLVMDATVTDAEDTDLTVVAVITSAGDPRPNLVPLARVAAVSAGSPADYAGTFEVPPVSPDVKANQAGEYKVYSVTVSVDDGHNPPQQATAREQIVVNKTGAPPCPPEDFPCQ